MDSKIIAWPDGSAALIQVCQKIGGVAETNCHFTAGLSARITATGKALGDMTVGELVAVIEKHSEAYNRIHSIPA